MVRILRERKRVRARRRRVGMLRSEGRVSGEEAEEEAFGRLESRALKRPKQVLIVVMRWVRREGGRSLTRRGR